MGFTGFVASYGFITGYGDYGDLQGLMEDVYRVCRS